MQPSQTKKKVTGDRGLEPGGSTLHTCICFKFGIAVYLLLNRKFLKYRNTMYGNRMCKIENPQRTKKKGAGDRVGGFEPCGSSPRSA